MLYKEGRRVNRTASPLSTGDIRKHERKDKSQFKTEFYKLLILVWVVIMQRKLS